MGLCEFAKATFEIMLPGRDGTAPYTHYKSVEKQTGEPPPELQAYEQIEFPIELAGIWEDFQSISKRRHYAEAGPCPITFQDIQAWAYSYNVELKELQVDIICRLDNIWLSEWNKKRQ